MDTEWLDRLLRELTDANYPATAEAVRQARDYLLFGTPASLRKRAEMVKGITVVMAALDADALHFVATPVPGHWLKALASLSHHLGLARDQIIASFPE